MNKQEFFTRVNATGFNAVYVESQDKPFMVRWTGHTETVSVMGCEDDQEATCTTCYATAEEAIAAAESTAAAEGM